MKLQKFNHTIPDLALLNICGGMFGPFINTHGPVPSLVITGTAPGMFAKEILKGALAGAAGAAAYSPNNPAAIGTGAACGAIINGATHCIDQIHIQESNRPSGLESCLIIPGSEIKQM